MQTSQAKKQMLFLLFALTLKSFTESAGGTSPTTKVVDISQAILNFTLTLM